MALVLVVAGCTSAGGNPQPLHFEPPGAEPYGTDLQARLNAALLAKGKDYVPRTRHLRDGGGAPRYTNRLIFTENPYLLQHAHNPVNWFPWGEEAFAEAKRLGRPVLLSVGYSTCHWCHVMEEESFEDEEIAAYLNANYVTIKVDREERPDIDSIYMTAIQLMAGRGGWPLNVWLTPDADPFYGGTYFPARDGDRGASKGFLTLLRELKQVFDAQPERIGQIAEQVARQVQQSILPTPGEDVPGVESLAADIEPFRQNFDPAHGGYRRTPKFPSSLPVRLFFRHHLRTGDPGWLDMARVTLEKMADGGIRDHLGGGFHRYSTDERWLVPHFEKMLYDNAMLAIAYLEAYQVTRDEKFAEVTRDTLRYVAREMTSPEGGFYSATDADSLSPTGERDEGWFFTWTPAEVESALPPEEAAAFMDYYGVTEAGNFEGRTILSVSRPIERLAAERGLELEHLRSLLTSAREKLDRVRAARPAPLRDDKIVASWNGLMISAFARAGFVLGEPDLVQRAERAAAFVLERLRHDGRLRRSYRSGQVQKHGYLDDHSFVIAGLLDLYEATFDLRWAREAVALQEVLDTHFADRDTGGYFMTADDAEPLLAREKPFRDGAEPSGNSVALMNLVRLTAWTGDDRYRASADALLHACATSLRGSPDMLLGLDFRLGRPREIVIVTGTEPAGAEPFLDVLRDNFIPNRVVVATAPGPDLDAAADLFPTVAGKVAIQGKTTAYICELGRCAPPTTDAGAFAERVLSRPAARDGLARPRAGG